MFTFVSVVSAGLAILRSGTFGKQLWASILTRKKTTCKRCGKDIEKFSTAWRPVTNDKNRMWRLCRACMDELIK